MKYQTCQKKIQATSLKYYTLLTNSSQMSKTVTLQTQKTATHFNNEEVSGTVNNTVYEHFELSLNRQIKVLCTTRIERVGKDNNTDLNAIENTETVGLGKEGWKNKALGLRVFILLASAHRLVGFCNPGESPDYSNE
jgi:hypothetical protein